MKGDGGEKERVFRRKETKAAKITSGNMAVACEGARKEVA